MLRNFFRRAREVFTREAELPEDFFDDLEDALIQADVGAETTVRLVDEVRRQAERDDIRDPEVVRGLLRDAVAGVLEAHAGPLNQAAEPPTVVLVVGVNGTGKTTFCARLAHLHQREGQKVLLAAADTFRAAAIDQLEIWAQRLNCDIVRQQPGSDPGAVVFDAITAARARGHDLIVADTAGRLHTKANLMDELRKIGRVVERALDRPADEVLLVVDGTTGQNAVQQAKLFAKAVPLTGVVVTKVDGTAKGGVLITLADELDLPIKFLGVGERARDLVAFQPRAFAESLFDDASAAAGPGDSPRQPGPTAPPASPPSRSN